MKALRIALAIILFLFSIVYLGFLLPFWGIPFNARRHGLPPLTPAWALECWLWEDDLNTASYVDELLDGYRQHDIPVRTILIDSPWSLRYNDFTFDEKRYPDPAQWLTGLQQKDYRVVLWMTSMVNSRNKDTEIPGSEDWYARAAENGYLLGNGQQIRWWKGKGGFIDYTNPDAMRWWRDLQNQVLRYGVDGWKLDGTATLMRSQAGPVPVPYMKSRSGILTTRRYMDLYYREELKHGRSVNPEFITLSRAMDRGFHPEGFAPVDAAPVTWVGDQRHYWKSDTDSGIKSGKKDRDIALKGIQGFESAINSILKSAALGYNVIGSDVAGFSGDSIPPRLYIRWAQFSAFCGLFMNGGHGEWAFWKRSRRELEIIRTYSWLHTELIPYMYHYVVSGHRGGKLLQTPAGGKYQYYFGDHLLIAPIFEDKTIRRVEIPEGKWRYWFDKEKVFHGPQTIEVDFPLDEFPVFVREGAIIPMDISRSYTNIGDSTYAGHTTWRIFPGNKLSFSVFSPGDQSETSLSVVSSGARIELTLSGAARPSVFSVHLEKEPRRVAAGHRILKAGYDYRYDAVRKELIIRHSSGLPETYLVSAG
ncbi:MAG: glycoside hydrolase [Cytophagaceae bacterium SCN 52-12]|nr:MAG: glycoside hydrolase [Cytophagaceae bacterium SCN 52-12]